VPLGCCHGLLGGERCCLRPTAERLYFPPQARGLAEFEQTDYRLTAAQYTTYEINDPWVLARLLGKGRSHPPPRTSLATTPAFFRSSDNK